jgi:hypothetical protein
VPSARSDGSECVAYRRAEGGRQATLVKPQASLGKLDRVLISVHDGLIDQPLCVLCAVLDGVCDHCAIAETCVETAPGLPPITGQSSAGSIAYLRQDVPDRMQAGHAMNKGDQGQRRCDIRQINTSKELSEFGDQGIEVTLDINQADRRGEFWQIRETIERRGDVSRSAPLRRDDRQTSYRRSRRHPSRCDRRRAG